MAAGQGDQQRQPQQGTADRQQVGEAAQRLAPEENLAILCLGAVFSRFSAGAAAEWLDPKNPAWLSSAPLPR